MHEFGGARNGIKSLRIILESRFENMTKVKDVLCKGNKDNKWWRLKTRFCIIAPFTLNLTHRSVYVCARECTMLMCISKRRYAFSWKFEIDMQKTTFCPLQCAMSFTILIIPWKRYYYSEDLVCTSICFILYRKSIILFNVNFSIDPRTNLRQNKFLKLIF